MNANTHVKRFTARTSRDALTMVRHSFGEDAVVLSTRPCAEGVEVLAMAPEGMKQLDKISAAAPHVRAGDKASAPAATAPVAPRTKAAGEAAAAPKDLRDTLAAAAPKARTPAATATRGFGRIEPQFDMPAAEPARTAALPAPAANANPAVEEDVEALSMSTLSFQDYVRERMLKRRQAELESGAAHPLVGGLAAAVAEAEGSAPVAAPEPEPVPAPAPQAAPRQPVPLAAARAARPVPPVLRDELDPPAQVIRLADNSAAAQRERSDRSDMLAEIRSMKGLIEERFGALAFMEKLNRNPKQVALSQRLMEAGFSPALVRKLVDSLPADTADELAWSANILERNLVTDEADPAIEDIGGVYALIGSTGVGKTTSTAKIAAAFATKHGASNLGLITLDAYRVAAHEQLRAYGRILGVPVHTAHDRASLEDLLGLLASKKMILIDTAGMAQRDARTRELLDMLAHRDIQKLLVVNAAQQGETIEDVMVAWRAGACRGVIVSKLDEAVKLAPALDSLIRHKVKVVGVANGQRVPEDWHRLSANALVHRALRGGGQASWRLDASDVNIVFAGVNHTVAAAPARPAAI
ncbi:flagellar biosynthetic protein FlhF [Burkholderiales bacterium JOSHI_001]|nr:flagellar biosynthetic protein FlhF [Burkholderiales bacterium JOSHI_001]